MKKKKRAVHFLGKTFCAGCFSIVAVLKNWSTELLRMVKTKGSYFYHFNISTDCRGCLELKLRHNLRHQDQQLICSFLCFTEHDISDSLVHTDEFLPILAKPSYIHMRFYLELLLTRVCDLRPIVYRSLFSDSCGLAGFQLPLS